MDTALWVIQVLLAIAFFISGILKVTQPVDKMAVRMKWVNDLTPTQIRGIGVLEVLGAIGLILPALTHVLVFLTPLAAVGLALTMVGAMLLHLRRNEPGHMIPNVVLLILALVVVYGRFVAVPLS